MVIWGSTIFTRDSQMSGNPIIAEILPFIQAKYFSAFGGKLTDSILQNLFEIFSIYNRTIWFNLIS